MDRRQLAAAWILAALLLPASARAATLAPISQTRFVSLEDVPRAALVRTDAVGFESFDASLGPDLVSQISSFDATRILVSARHDAATGVTGPAGEVLAHFVVESFFSATFELDQAAPYTFAAQIEELDAVTDLAEFFPWWDLEIVLETSLEGPMGSVAGFSFELQADCAFQESCSFATPLISAGVLEPGIYTLTARSFAELDTDVVCVGFLCGANPAVSGSSSAGSVSVDLQLLPEPGSALGVGIGLASLAAGGRRRRARAA